MELAPDGERLAGDQLSFVLLRRDGQIVLASRKLGLLHYRDGRLERWTTELDDWVHEQIVVPGLELADGSLVLGSLRAGLARMDRAGKVLQFLDERDGLPSNSVYALATDDQENLWAGFDGGIARIGWPDAVSVYDRRQGVSTVWGIARHRGRLLLATRLGLLAANDGTMGRSLGFERVAGQPTQAWEMLSVGDALWVAGSDGVWRIRNTDATLWAGTPNGRLLRLPAGADALQVLDQSSGLPPGMSWPIVVDGKTLFGSVTGLRRRAAGRIDAAPEFAATNAQCGDIARAAQTAANEVWIACANYTGVARRTAAGVWQFDPDPLAALAHETVYAFFRDDDGVIWIGRERSLLRFDPRLSDSTARAAVTPLLRGVYAIGAQGYTPLASPAPGAP